MKEFSKNITVTTKHLDELNHVNNVQYVQWVQDIAKSHWEIIASRDLKKEYLWVMVSHNIAYKGQAFLNDKLLLKTHINKIGKTISERTVQILNINTNKILAHSITKWCLLNKQKNRPTRLTTELETLFN